MRCLGYGSAAMTERPERTAQGYRRFRCRECGRQFNERSAGLLNRTQYPSDVIALVVLWRLRYKLSLRDLAEMFLIRGTSAGRFCRAFDELRSFLRVRSFHRQHVSADRRRLRQLCGTVTVLGILEAA